MEQYTEINDSDNRWYARSVDLVSVLVEVGYTCDAYQGTWALAQPAQDEDAWGEDPYSALCSRVSWVDGDDIPTGTLVEELAYEPALVGQNRLRCTGDLYQAVWNATD